MKQLFVFLPSSGSNLKAEVFTALEGLNARVRMALKGRDLAVHSRTAMNRLVEGTNTHSVNLYTEDDGEYVGTVRVADFHE